MSRNGIIFGGGEVFHTSEDIRADYSKHASKTTKSHMMHKPYANDFAECLERIEMEKYDTGGLEYNGL